MMDLINQLLEKIKELDNKVTNQYKKYLMVLKRIKKIEEELMELLKKRRIKENEQNKS